MTPLIFKEPGLITAATADILDINKLERGAPALETRDSIQEGTYLLKVGFGH